MKNRISIIIPCYNCENYIEKTFLSIINQIEDEDEIMLINDGSSDNTLDIIKEIKYKYRSHQIRIINMENNVGVSRCRNYAVNMAKGNLILFLDSDDVCHENLISEEKKIFESFNECEEKWIGVYPAYCQIDEEDNIISDICRGIMLRFPEAFGYEIIRNYIPTSGTMVFKSAIVEAGYFDENISYAEDWDLWLRMCNNGGIYYIDKPLINIRRHRNNSSNNICKMIQHEKIILKKYDLEFIKKSILKRNIDIKENIIDYVLLLFKLNYWEEGLSELQNLDYKNIRIDFLKGLYYLNNKKFDEALKQFKFVLKSNEYHAESLNNAGAIYILKKDFVNGKNYLNRALKIRPNYLDALHNIKILNENKAFDVKFTNRELRKVLTNY